MKKNTSSHASVAETTRILTQLMRDENAWVGDDWNAAWEKLKKDLFDRKLIQS